MRTASAHPSTISGHRPLACRSFRYSARYQAERGSIPQARHDLTKALQDIQPDPDLVEALALCLSELVTNAVVHAAHEDVHQGYRVTAWLRGIHAPLLRLGVWDRSPGHVPRLPPPALGDVDDDALGGRGLALVAALSRSVGCDRVPGLGKTIWCDMPIHGPAL